MAPAAGAALPQHTDGPTRLRLRLSIVMFMQSAILGIWLPVVARYLSAPVEAGGLAFSGAQVGLILGLAGSVGALTAPLVGQMADRWVSTQRLMAVLIIAAGVIKYFTAWQTSFAWWLVLSVSYSILYVPTQSLANSLAFSHMSDPDRQFPAVRVWGTVGWIVVAWTFPMLWLQSGLHLAWKPPFIVGTEVRGVTSRLVDALKGSGILSVVYGLYCLTLPHTPPRQSTKAPLAFLEAFRMCRVRSFAVLMAAGLVVSMMHNLYYMQTSPFLSSIGVRDADLMPAMSVAQASEIVMIALLGWLLARLGVRRVLLIGASAYIARYLVFGTTWLPVPVIIASQALHGFCYACFFATAFIYINRLAGDDIRHSAQTVFGIVVLGLGPLAGGWLNGVLARAFSGADGTIDYAGFWYTASAIAVVGVAALLIVFKDESEQKRPAGA